MSTFYVNSWNSKLERENEVAKVRWVLFKFLMWLSRKERRGYEEGYWRGWCNALYAIKSGEAAIDKPPVEDTDKRTAYPATAYAPSEQERHTDKVASTTTQ